MKMRFWVISSLIGAIKATFPENYSPLPSDYDDIQRKYDVTFTFNLPNSFSPISEGSLNWEYFNQAPFTTLGYDNSVSRGFTQTIRNKSLVDVSFFLTFNAGVFKDNFPTVGQEFIFAMSTDQLNTGLGLNAGSLDPLSTATPRDNCEAANTAGTKLCKAMSCREIDPSGAVKCSSQCAAGNIGQYCGANGECAQSDVDSNHVCSCPSDTWWTSGNGDDPNNFGDNADPCKPVLENWLIIVIGVFGFLLIVLIIILIIYCCVRGCVCPCDCTCCEKQDEPDDSKGELKYPVTHSPVGRTNAAYQEDLVETGSQRPLYEKYLPEDKLQQNPAVWSETSYTREFHHPNRSGGQDSFHTDAVGETSTLPPSVSVHHERHQNRHHRERDYSTVDNPSRERRRDRSREKRRHRRRRSRDRSPPKEVGDHPFTKEMKREIKKLQTEIDTLKRDIDQPPNDESILSGTSTIQAPLAPTGPIDALELSDENVDDTNMYSSKAVLVPAQPPPNEADLRSTLKERWRVPTLTVKPLDDQQSVSQVESSVI